MIDNFNHEVAKRSALEKENQLQDLVKRGMGDVEANDGLADCLDSDEDEAADCLDSDGAADVGEHKNMVFNCVLH